MSSKNLFKKRALDPKRTPPPLGQISFIFMQFSTKVLSWGWRTPQKNLGSTTDDDFVTTVNNAICSFP